MVVDAAPAAVVTTINAAGQAVVTAGSAAVTAGQWVGNQIIAAPGAIYDTTSRRLVPAMVTWRLRLQCSRGCGRGPG